MYRYDEFDHTVVRERVVQFREQVGRRLAGEITEDEFKPLRLMNGLYLQLHAYMLSGRDPVWHVIKSTDADPRPYCTRL